MDELPLYEMYLDGSDMDGIWGIALVDDPAIERNWLAMSKQPDQQIKFSEVKDKQELVGAVLIPDQEIYREDYFGNPYKVKFTAQQIKAAGKKFMKMRLTNAFNLDHDKSVSDVYAFEMWYVGRNDKLYSLSSDFTPELYPEGTLMISVAVENKEVWQRIKAGDWKGFSMEGFFSLLEVDFKATLSRIQSLHETLNDDKVTDLDKLSAIQQFSKMKV